MHQSNKNHDFVIFKGLDGIGLIDCVTPSNPVEIDYPVMGTARFYPWSFRCCDGLVCIVDECNTTWLWNPSTRKHRSLPPGNYMKKGLHCSVFGFGYDPSSDDYFIIRGFCSNSGIVQSEVEIYSLNKNSWTTLEAIPHAVYSYGNPTLLDDVLHWASVQCTHDCRKSSILAFDIRGRDFHEVQLPDDDYVNWHQIHISVLDRCLCMCYSLHSHLEVWEVWAMKEYGVRESWVRLFTIKEQIRMNLMCVSKNGELIMRYNTRAGTQLCLYDPKTQSSKDLKTRNIPYGPPWSGMSFVESLVQL